MRCLMVRIMARSTPPRLDGPQQFDPWGQNDIERAREPVIQRNIDFFHESWSGKRASISIRSQHMADLCRDRFRRDVDRCEATDTNQRSRVTDQYDPSGI